MSIRFTCPHCGVETLVADEFVGRTGPCGSCGREISVEAPAGNPKPPVKSSGSSTAAIVAVALAVVVVGFLVCGGILVALLLPAGQSAREAARRMQCTNNMKQIALALHNYHDVYSTFPPAYTVDEQGQPLHSWRTLILPYMDQQGLYNQIDLSEPWNSPSNASLASMPIMQYQYHCPSSANAACSYVALVGPGMIFEGSTPVAIKDITDGTSKTILVVEVAGRTKSWMEPVDINVGQMPAAINAGRPNYTGNGMSSFHPGGLNVAMADGSLRFISQTVAPPVLQGLMTRDGGENTQLP